MKSFEISSKKLQDFYTVKPNAPFLQKEFGFYSLDRWTAEGYLKNEAEVSNYYEYIDGLFGFDTDPTHKIFQLGWCEAGLLPVFEEKVLEDRGEHELVQDFAGRHVLYFKGRRSGFMPEYVDHPVKDMDTWKKQIEWRMDPSTPLRLRKNTEAAKAAKASQDKGAFIVQCIVGGYMYLRSLNGPEELLYKFYDDPKLIHACMEKWLALAEAVCARLQEHVAFDEVFFGEDICYNHGPLISPDMIVEFLIPYYQQLLKNIKSRQKDNRKLNIQIDTDGFCEPVIDIYRDAIGMNYMSPFEVASNCNIHRVSQKYPDLLISGGIDKRVLCQSKDEIDRYLEGLLPPMIKRGGYLPTCDHGVPEEVPFESYLHYRKRMLEYGR